MRWIEDLWGLRSTYLDYIPRKGVSRERAHYHGVPDDELLYMVRFDHELVEVGSRALYEGVPGEVSELVVGFTVAISTVKEADWLIHFVLAFVPFADEKWRKYLVFHNSKCGLDGAIRVPITTNPVTKFRIIDRCMRYLRKRSAAAAKALNRVRSEGVHAVLDHFEMSDAQIPARLLHHVWRIGAWWLPRSRVRVNEIVAVARLVRNEEARKLAAALAYFREVGLI